MPDQRYIDMINANGGDDTKQFQIDYITAVEADGCVLDMEDPIIRVWHPNGPQIATLDTRTGEVVVIA